MGYKLMIQSVSGGFYSAALSYPIPKPTCFFHKPILVLFHVGKRPVCLHPIYKQITPDAEKGMQE